MKHYQILTDSTCDFPNGYYEKLDVTVVPLTVRFRDQEQQDTNDDSLHSLYQGLRAGETATTSAINPQRWASAMEPALKEGRDVLVLAFSSGISSTQRYTLSISMPSSRFLQAYQTSRPSPREADRVSDT